MIGETWLNDPISGLQAPCPCFSKLPPIAATIDLTTTPMVKSLDNEDNEWLIFGTIAHSFGRNK